MLSMTLPFALAWLLKAKERRERLIYARRRPAADRRRGGDPEEDEHDRAAGLHRWSSSPTGRGRWRSWRRWRSSWSRGARGRAGRARRGHRPARAGNGDQGQHDQRPGQRLRSDEPDLAAHPLIGRGYGSYDQKQHRILDNQYLTLAIGVGLLGLIGYLAIFFTSFFSAHRVARSGDPERPRPRSPPPRRSSSPSSPAPSSTSSPSRSCPISSASSRRSPSSPGVTTPRKPPPTDPRTLRSESQREVQHFGAAGCPGVAGDEALALGLAHRSGGQGLADAGDEVTTGSNANNRGIGTAHRLEVGGDDRGPPARYS